VPDTAPGAEERARAQLAGDAALRDSRVRLDAAGSLLSTVEDRRAGVPASARNALVYAGFAIVTVLLPLIAFQVSTDGCSGYPSSAARPCSGARVRAGLAHRRQERADSVLGAAVTVAVVLLLYVLYLALLVTRTL